MSYRTNFCKFGIGHRNFASFKYLVTFKQSSVFVICKLITEDWSHLVISKKKPYISSSIFSEHQIYDFHQGLGDIVGNSYTKSFARITDYGKNKISLPPLPYGGESVIGPCVVYVNETTIFYAGGISE